MKIGDFVEVVKENNEENTRYVGKTGTITGKTAEGLYIVEIDDPTEEGTTIAKKVKLADKPNKNEQEVS